MPRAKGDYLMSTRTARRRRYRIPLALCVLSAALLLPAGASPGPSVAASHSHLFLSPRIREIQGAGHISPLDKTEVSGVNGIVTAKRANGFFMQDPAPDTDPRTSEGIFVFTNAAPANVSPGDAVRVAGTVREQRQGVDAASNANLTVTQINASSVTVISNGNLLPRPVVIGAGGRVPPGRVIEDDAGGNVETGGVFDPAADGVDFYESSKGCSCGSTTRPSSGRRA